jgi:predicted nicotinamide N-methyase
MPNATAPQGPNPALLFETINAYQRTAAIKGAIELDLFTAIAEGQRTASSIARRCSASERGVRILCDYLTVLGFLTKNSDQYSLTPDSAVFLVRTSPAYVGRMTEFLLMPELRQAFDDVAGTVRKGGTVISKEGTVSDENPVWVSFARAMAPAMMRGAQLLAERLDPEPTAPMRVLDIAAGHGMFGISIARRNPKAHVTALDWKPVLEVAQENANRAGLSDRYRTLPGSAFEADFGGPYDVILLTNFLHHFDTPTCEKLLKRVHAALTPNGRAATVEFIPNDDRITPPEAATFSFTMLNSTPAGDAYTFAELDGMFRRTGFTKSELIPLPGTPNRAVISGV